MSESQGCIGSLVADTENTTFKATKMGEYLGFQNDSKTITETIAQIHEKVLGKTMSHVCAMTANSQLFTSLCKAAPNY